jgi:DNA/RNA endonuclease YhcR with UshA esterase domain
VRPSAAGTVGKEAIMTLVYGLAAAMLWAIISPAVAAEIAPDDAAKHVGEGATVCGIVESARYAERSTKQPTFLNLGKPYPNQSFTVVIFGGDRGKFGTPEIALMKKRVCATGVISLFQGRPEMKLQEPSQLSSR